MGAALCRHERGAGAGHRGIGLTADQFQRVILLPQGDFEQFLTARGDDRRPLLRQLFGSGVFDRAVSKLKEAANEAVRAADAVRDDLERYRFAAIEQLTAAEERLGAEPIEGEHAGDVRLEERLAIVERATAKMHTNWQQAERAAAVAAEAAVTARDVARRWRLRAERRSRAEYTGGRASRARGRAFPSRAGPSQRPRPPSARCVGGGHGRGGRRRCSCRCRSLWSRRWR